MIDVGRPRLIALLHGPDRPGLVAGVSGWIYGKGGTILHADQHHDANTGAFFQRVEWGSTSGDPGAEAAAFRGTFVRSADPLENRPNPYADPQVTNRAILPFDRVEIGET